MEPGYQNSSSLEKAVLRFAKEPSVQWSQDFVFLSCDNSSEKTQLLHFDSGYFEKTTVPTGKKEKKKKEKKNEEKDEQKININLVWLDSLSRRHFYRSLPKTVETMSQINSDSTNKNEVLDFELMQSVHGHTHESLIALIQGIVLPKGMTEDERSDAPIRLETLVKFMHEAGYNVLYQEDMCPKGYWGLNSEYKASKSWKKLAKILKEDVQIDEFGK